MMSESKKLEQSNRESSTGIQSDIKAQEVFQANTINIHNGRNSAADIKLKGNIKDLTIEELVKLQQSLGILQEMTGDISLRFTTLEEGCIKLTIEGSGESFQKLEELNESGQLSEILGKTVESIQESTRIGNKLIIGNPVKALLIEKIRSNKGGLREANLKGADLSGADLSGADLSEADLSGADLRGVNLRAASLQIAKLRGAALNGANLRGAALNGANFFRAALNGANLIGVNLRAAVLIEVDLSEADLSEADLRGANFSESNLSKANFVKTNVQNAIFTDTEGISELAKADLKYRGAIFEDSPGDRSEVRSPIRR